MRTSSRPQDEAARRVTAWTILWLLATTALLLLPLGCASAKDYHQTRLEDDGVHGPGVNRVAETGPQLEAFRINQSF